MCKSQDFACGVCCAGLCLACLVFSTKCTSLTCPIITQFLLLLNSLRISANSYPISIFINNSLEFLSCLCCMWEFFFNMESLLPIEFACQHHTYRVISVLCSSEFETIGIDHRILPLHKMLADISSLISIKEDRIKIKIRRKRQRTQATIDPP